MCVHVKWSNCLLLKLMCCSPTMCRDRRVTWTRRSWLHLEFLDIREIHDIEDVFNFLWCRHFENYEWVHFTSFSKWLIRQKCLLTWSNSFYEKDHPHIKFRMGEICDDNLSSHDKKGLKSTNKFFQSVWLDFLRPLSVDAEMICELNMIESVEKIVLEIRQKKIEKSIKDISTMPHLRSFISDLLYHRFRCKKNLNWTLSEIITRYSSFVYTTFCQFLLIMLLDTYDRCFGGLKCSR